RRDRLDPAAAHLARGRAPAGRAAPPRLDLSSLTDTYARWPAPEDYPGRMEQRRLRTSESFVAGVSAMLLATAVLGFAHLVQASVPFPSLGLAQRFLGWVPGPLAVFFIDHLGHWALRAFAAGFTVGGILVGGLAGIAVSRQD